MLRGVRLLRPEGGGVAREGRGNDGEGAGPSRRQRGGPLQFRRAGPAVLQQHNGVLPGVGDAPDRGRRGDRRLRLRADAGGRGLHTGRAVGPFVVFSSGGRSGCCRTNKYAMHRQELNL